MTSPAVFTTKNATFHKERTPPAPFCGANDSIELLRDRIPQPAASFQATSIELDEGNETDEERLQRALDRSMMDGNDNDEIGSFQDTSIKPDEGDETDEERLQRALDMSMIENGCVRGQPRTQAIRGWPGYGGPSADGLGMAGHRRMAWPSKLPH